MTLIPPRDGMWPASPAQNGRIFLYCIFLYLFFHTGFVRRPLLKSGSMQFKFIAGWNGSVKVIRILAALLLCWLTPRPGAAQAPAQGGLLDFIAAHRDRHFDGVPHEVLAFYYTWYGRPDRQGHWMHWGGENLTNHSTPQTTHYPARGAYDSQDPAVVDGHILEAKSHGVSGFIATWWGQGSYEDHSFALLLAHAEQKDFKASLYWETAPGSGREQIDLAIADLVYMLSRYGASKAFLKVDQKPVIFVYGRVMGQDRLLVDVLKFAAAKIGAPATH